VIVSTVTLVNEPRGYPWPSFVLLGLVGVLSAVTLGYAAGLALPRWYTPPLVAVAVYGFFLATAQSFSWVRGMSPWPNNIVDAPWYQLVVPLAVAQVSWLAGSAVLALLAACRWIDPSSRIPVSARVAAVAVLLCGVVVVGYHDGRTMEPRTPVEWYCVDSRPVLCAWPEHSAVLRARQDEVLVVAARLRPYVALPEWIAEPGMTTQLPELRFPLGDAGAEDEHRLIAGGLLRGTVPALRPACLDGRLDMQQRYRLLDRFLFSVASGWRVPVPAGDDGASLSRLRESRPVEVRAWLAETRRMLRPCEWRDDASPPR
jgi:hypothetical protein